MWGRRAGDGKTERERGGIGGGWVTTLRYTWCFAEVQRGRDRSDGVEVGGDDGSGGLRRKCIEGDDPTWFGTGWIRCGQIFLLVFSQG